MFSLNWMEELATATARLTDAQLSALRVTFVRGSPVDAGTLRRLGLTTGEAIQVAKQIQFALMAGGEEASRDAAIAIEAIRAGRSVRQACPEVQIVCTTPVGTPVPVRATFATTIEMIRTATREILVVGYLFTGGAKEVLRELAAVGQARGVQVTLVGNRLSEHVGLLKSIWNRRGSRPNLLSREMDPADPLSALHAKLLVRDRCDALITSANLSSHGLHHNVEIGIRVKAPEMSSLVDFVQSMVSGGELTHVGWDA